MSKDKTLAHGAISHIRMGIEALEQMDDKNLRPYVGWMLADAIADIEDWIDENKNPERKISIEHD